MRKKNKAKKSSPRKCKELPPPVTCDMKMDIFNADFVPGREGREVVIDTGGSFSTHSRLIFNKKEIKQMADFFAGVYRSME